MFDYYQYYLERYQYYISINVNEHEAEVAAAEDAKEREAFDRDERLLEACRYYDIIE